MVTGAQVPCAKPHAVAIWTQCNRRVRLAAPRIRGSVVSENLRESPDTRDETPHAD